MMKQCDACARNHPVAVVGSDMVCCIECQRVFEADGSEIIAEFTFQDGMVEQGYSVERDGEDWKIFHVLDTDSGHPIDVIHIDVKARRRIALALLTEEEKPAASFEAGVDMAARAIRTFESQMPPGLSALQALRMVAGLLKPDVQEAKVIPISMGRAR